MESLLTLEQSVAKLVTDLTYEQITAEALSAVNQLFEDQLALQIGCTDLPWNQAVLKLTESSHAPGNAHVTMAGSQTFSAKDAAFVNATYGHSFEYDDHHPSASHPGSAVIPAALAIGEEIGATMREVVTGMVAGYEVYTRIGNLIARELLRGGFHPHPILSTFGAAAVVAKMKGFDLDTTQHALAIASSHASGLTEYSSSGGSVKRVHAGIGTRNGMHSAELAAVGITGPTKFLTGPKGFLKSFGGFTATDETAADFDLSRTFEVSKFWLKPYCCCGINHAYIDGARQLADRTDDISSVLLKIQPSGDLVVGNSNANAFAPQTIDHLQYSLPYQFSLSLLGYGNGFSTHQAYLSGRLDISEGTDVEKLASKITIRADEELEASNPGRWVGDITVKYASGETRHVFVGTPAGTPGNEMTQEDLDAKFRDLTATALGAEGSEQLLHAVKGIDPSQTVADFAAHLQRQAMPAE